MSEMSVNVRMIEINEDDRTTGLNTRNGEIILDVKNLTHCFKRPGGQLVEAVKNVNVSVDKGEIFGIVGESGSGKSTLARCIMNIYKSTKGDILYQGINVCDAKQWRANKKLLCTTRQIIFQDSDTGLNQRMKVEDIIAEPMQINSITPKRGTYRKEAEFQLKYVGLDKECLDKYPHELSGGMRQRVAIARALSMEPELLIADEPVASLDVSTQAQILNLFKHLQMEHGFTVVFIAHDLAVVKSICDRVAVMHKGEIVEVAPTKELFEKPSHPYTKKLLSAMLEVPSESMSAILEVPNEIE